jgi:hypothetical protein
MHCYAHRDVAALGVCGMCGRGLCAICARETPTKLTCSDACAAEAEAQKLIIDFSKRNLSVTKSTRFPSTTIFLASVGLLFIGWGAFQRLRHGGDVDWFIIVLGTMFVFAAANTYRLNKKVTRGS